MTDKPSCETCAFATCYVLDASKISTSDPNHNPFPMVYACKEKNGKWMHADEVCLSHPQAREYLMKDVLEELEWRKDEIHCSKLAEVIYDEAIALIKGVEKK